MSAKCRPTQNALRLGPNVLRENWLWCMIRPLCTFPSKELLCDVLALMANHGDHNTGLGTGALRLIIETMTNSE